MFTSSRRKRKISRLLASRRIVECINAISIESDIRHSRKLSGEGSPTRKLARAPYAPGNLFHHSVPHRQTGGWQEWWGPERVLAARVSRSPGPVGALRVSAYRPRIAFSPSRTPRKERERERKRYASLHSVRVRASLSLFLVQIPVRASPPPPPRLVLEGEKQKQGKKEEQETKERSFALRDAREEGDRRSL